MNTKQENLINQLAWTPAQFAQLTGKSYRTVQRWIQNGDLEVVRVGINGNPLIPRVSGLKLLGMNESDVGPERKRA